jgi:hypothetical protein
LDIPFSNFIFVMLIDLYWWILNVDAVKDLYDKMLQSVNVKRSMPPNAWLWSMIANCKHHHDISLLFDILQNLRRFVSFYSLPLWPLYFQLFIYIFTLFAMVMNLFGEQRLSNLRIHDNFNCHLCREVTKACVHAGALDFGMLFLHVHFVFYKSVLFCLWNLKIWNEILSRKDGFVEA